MLRRLLSCALLLTLSACGDDAPRVLAVSIPTGLQGLSSRLLPGMINVRLSRLPDPTNRNIDKVYLQAAAGSRVPGQTRFEAVGEERIVFFDPDAALEQSTAYEFVIEPVQPTTLSAEPEGDRLVVAFTTGRAATDLAQGRISEVLLDGDFSDGLNLFDLQGARTDALGGYQVTGENTFAHQGNVYAYAHRGNVVVQGFAGTTAHQTLRFGEPFGMSPTFDATDNRVAFVVEDTLHLFDRVSRDEVLVYGTRIPAGVPAVLDWCPNPNPAATWFNHLVFVRSGEGEDRALYTLKVEAGATPVKLDSSRPWASPRWSPDCRYVAATSSVARTDEPGLTADDLFVVDTGVGSVLGVTHTDWQERSPRWSPDGTLLGYLVDGVIGTLDSSAARAFTSLWVNDLSGGVARATSPQNLLNAWTVARSMDWR